MAKEPWQEDIYENQEETRSDVVRENKVEECWLIVS